MKMINIFILSVLFTLISSNLWDNIYSQSSSPHFNIPDNFQLLLKNEKDDSTAGELFVSSEHNLIKFSFILDESNVKEAFIHLLIDFNSGKIYFDTQEKCVYLSYELAGQLTTKFLLNAYDLLSYFSEDENYYHYIVINPLELTKVDEEQINKIPSLIRNLLVNLDKIVFQKKTIYDKSFYGDFIIDKKELTIKSIKIKTLNSLNTFNTNFQSYNVEKERFNGIHNLEDCVEYEG